MSGKESFVYLDTRSSLGTPGAIAKPADYPLAAHALGADTVGLADGSIKAWPLFDKECASGGIKPLFGVDIEYVMPLDQAPRMVTFLVSQDAGFDSLCRLSGLPRVELADIARHAAGVLALADSFSYEPLREVLDPKQLFLSVHNFGDEESARRLSGDVHLGRRMGAQFVASNKPWMATPRDGNQILSLVTYAHAHHIKLPQEYLTADMIGHVGINREVYGRVAQTVGKRDVSVYLTLFHPEMWMKPASSMGVLFENKQDALGATIDIARACSPERLPRPSLPAYVVPEGETPQHVLRVRCREALLSRYERVTKEVRRRLDYELTAFARGNLSEFLLIAGDLARDMRQHGVRHVAVGSAGGSLVCYLLGITNADPIANHLSFERFYNEKTTKVTDIDILVDAGRRQEQFARLMGVSQAENRYMYRISIFPTYNMASAIRTLMGVFGYGQREISDLQKRLEHHAPLSKQEAAVTQLAGTLAGRQLYSGIQNTHASKIVMTRGPLPPGYHARADHGVSVINIDKDIAKDWANFDLLISHPLEMLRLLEQKSGVPKKIPREDRETLAMLFGGRTIGIPFLESQWLIDVLTHMRKAGAGSQHDLTLALGLSRPAARASFYEYVRRRKDGVPVQYGHEDVKSILGETLGIVVFQEQIMDIALKVAGFSMTDAEVLRKAISKQRKTALMDTLYDPFIAGCQRHGLAEKTARDLFAQIRNFVGYGFLKSHAIALVDEIIYPCAFLKRHDPQPYFDVLFGLKTNLYFLMGRPDIYVREAERMGIRIPSSDVRNDAMGR